MDKFSQYVCPFDSFMVKKINLIIVLSNAVTFTQNFIFYVFVQIINSKLGKQNLNEQLAYELRDDY
jgi:hypothetical protein